MTSDLIWLSASRLLRGYRKGEFSPVEVVRAVLDRIKAVDGRLNAFCLVDRKAALAAARASEKRWREGRPLALDGVPTSIKDLVLTRGWPTLRGSRTVDPGQPWADDAPAVARLKEAGAVLIGKTTTPEFGWKGVTDSPLTGITRNPWDLTKTPGGSSGGAAAAMASGMGALAIGTDGGGSIRIPAGFSGIFGLKPSFGRVPAWPASPFGTVAHLGPMTRSVKDAALMLNVLAQPDARDWHALPYDGADYARGLDKGLKGLKIAWSPALGHADVDPEVAALVEKAVHSLASLGAEIERADPGFENPAPLFRTIWWAGARGIAARLPRKALKRLDPGLAQVVEQAQAITLEEFIAAQVERAAFGAHVKRFMTGYDLLVTPALPIPAFEAGRIAPETEEKGKWVNWTPFTYPFNLSQQPACSVPCGFTRAGLPVGLQIVGRMFDDRTVLRAARAYEQAHQWRKMRPPLE